jgi:hypothetical protein
MEVMMNSIDLHSSISPDNEHRLIINAILFANLAQMSVAAIGAANWSESLSSITCEAAHHVP